MISRSRKSLTEGNSPYLFIMSLREIEYTDINVESDKKAQDEMVEKSGQGGTPTIDIDGEIIVGFDEEKLKKVLKIK